MSLRVSRDWATPLTIGVFAMMAVTGGLIERRHDIPHQRLVALPHHARDHLDIGSNRRRKIRRQEGKNAPQQYNTQDKTVPFHID